MPGKLINIVTSSSAAASKIKSSLQNVTSKNNLPLKPGLAHRDTENMDLLKRHKNLLSRSVRKNSIVPATQSQNVEKFVRIEVVEESPPLVSFGPPADSSGALFSGQLKVTVVEKQLKFEKVEVQLFCSTSVKKPVVKDCDDCLSHSKEMKKWVFAKEPIVLTQGEHRFPISFLFEGKLPASTHSTLCMLDYHFAAHVKTVDDKFISITREVELKRAFYPSQDKQSIRVFPPTNISATLTHNPVIYQVGEIPLELRLSGVKNKTDKAHFRWKLRRLSWKIEEIESMLSLPCPKHVNKVPEGQKGITVEETRSIGEQEINYSKNPWKADYDAGEIDAVFKAQLDPRKRSTIDVSAPDMGMSITHHLILEMVVMEEMAPLRRPSMMTQTGSARILRAQFPIVLSERAGLGVAWDEEMPPVYQDVPPSPPTYMTDTTFVGDFDLDLSDDSSFEELALGEPLPEASGSNSRPSSAALAQAQVITATMSPRLQAQRNAAARNVSPRSPMVGISPRLQAQLDREAIPPLSMSPRVRPREPSAVRSSSRSVQLSADDLLQEPEYPRRQSEDIVEEPDVGSGTAA
jgi:hypothetical protein